LGKHGRLDGIVKKKKPTESSGIFSAKPLSFENSKPVFAMKTLLITIGVFLSFQTIGQVGKTRARCPQIMEFEKAKSIYDTLTTEAKILGLSTFWREASYNFVFFDKIKFNWDSMYYSYLPKIVATRNVYEYWTVLNPMQHLVLDSLITTRSYFKKPKLASINKGYLPYCI
jgi:hypothetical protein